MGSAEDVSYASIIIRKKGVSPEMLGVAAGSFPVGDPVYEKGGLRQRFLQDVPVFRVRMKIC
jgi:hypothetical protein